MAKLKEFKIQKRFQVWCETNIKAESLEQAISIGKAMGHHDFYEADSKTETIDIAPLDGFTVGESW